VHGIATRSAALLAAVALLALAGCGGGDEPAESSLKAPGGESSDDLAGGARGSETTPDDDPDAQGSKGDDDARGDAAGSTGGDAGGKDSSGPGGTSADGPGRAQGQALAKRDPATGPPDDVADAHAFMSDYLGRLRRGDASICTDLFTQGHVERVTGRKGDAALARCRSDIGGKRVDVTLRDLEGVNRLAPDRIELTAKIESGGRVQNSRLQLVGSSGGYRIDRGG